MEAQPLVVTEEVSDAMVTLGANRQKIEDALNLAHQKKRIDILVCNRPELPYVSLLSATDSLPIFFAEISTRSAVFVEELLPGNNPHILIVDSNLTDIRSIAKEIPTILRVYYPAVSDLPIAIFKSQKDFRKHDPAFIIEPRPTLFSLTKPTKAP